MITSKEEISSLRWFLSTPSAANFPQAMSSPGLSALQNAFSKLVKDIAYFSSKPDLREKALWLDLAGKTVVLDSRIREQFNSDVAFELIQTLRGVNSLLDLPVDGSPRDPDWDVLIYSYRAVLACLVVYAKDSKDFTFKRQVLELVRSFETK